MTPIASHSPPGYWRAVAFIAERAPHPSRSRRGNRRRAGVLTATEFFLRAVPASAPDEDGPMKSASFTENHRGLAGASGQRDESRSCAQAWALGGAQSTTGRPNSADGRVRGQPAEGARRRERKVEEALGRAEAALRAALAKWPPPPSARRAGRAFAGRHGPDGATRLPDRHRRSEDRPPPLVPATGRRSASDTGEWGGSCPVYARNTTATPCAPGAATPC